MISLSLLAAGAQAATSDVATSRAQVVAELQQARSAGLLSQHEADPYPVPVAVTSHKNRAEVLAELAQARSAGQLSLHEADPYPSPAAGADPVASRAQVLAELAQYQATHSREFIEH
jgi:hypothetical protein